VSFGLFGLGGGAVWHLALLKNRSGVARISRGGDQFCRRGDTRHVPDLRRLIGKIDL
jgi:hypothetical protein